MIYLWLSCWWFQCHFPNSRQQRYPNLLFEVWLPQSFGFFSFDFQYGRGQPWHSMEKGDNLDTQLRKGTALTPDWGKGPWHLIKERVSLDTWLRKGIALSLDWEREQPWHLIEEGDNLDIWLRKVTTLTIVRERGQPWHSILEGDNLDTQLRGTTLTPS